MIYLGIDPGSSAMGVCLAHEGGHDPRATTVVPRGKDARQRTLSAVEQLRYLFGNRLLQGEVTLCVEWQEHRRGREKNPQAVLEVQAYSGLAIAVAALAYHPARLLTPTPFQWKGQVAKKVHTPQLWAAFRQAGGRLWDGEPMHKANPDAMDAYGLAVWAIEQGRVSDFVDAWKGD